MPDEAPDTPEQGGDPEPGGKTFTQAQLDRIVEDRLARERQKYADYDEAKQALSKLKDLEDSKKSDEQKLLDRIEAAEKRAQEAEQAVKKAEIDALRARVQASHGLTDAQAKRLQGDTLDELTADAVEVFGEPKQPEPEEPAEKNFLRPQEKLTPGASNSSDDEAVDGAALAEKIYASRSPNL